MHLHWLKYVNTTLQVLGYQHTIKIQDLIFSTPKLHQVTCFQQATPAHSVEENYIKGMKSRKILQSVP